jgi:hypothetical protein
VIRFLLVLLLGFLCCSSRTAAQVPAVEDWKFDVLQLKNGNTWEGLVFKETPSEVGFRWVIRRPGRPVVVFNQVLKRSEITSIKRLDPPDREILENRLKALAVERKTWAALLRAVDPKTAKTAPSEFDRLELKPASWGKGGEGLGYQSTNFRLVSNAREDLVSLTATQLELIYGAYMRFLPPRVKAAQPTTVLLPQSSADYESLLKEQGRAFLNTAFYDIDHNQIVCPSDLQRLADEWTGAMRKHSELRTKLKELETDLKRLYNNKVPADLLNRLAKDRDRIQQTEVANRKKAESTLQHLFQPLYHEAFHAYLNNYVYLASETKVPRWLNEGLAQVFETAVLDAGELQVDRPDRERLAQAQKLATQGALVPLRDLLASGADQFLVAHNSDRQTSDRYYLTSWALAWYLTFDRKLLGTKALDEYVLSLQRGTGVQEAFQQLVGQPLEEFEKAFQQYLQRLRPEGA